MDEDTTTEQNAPVDTGADEAQPVTPEAADTADVSTDTEPSDESTGAEAETPSQPGVDDKLRKYTQSNGIELDSPGAIKAAQIGLKAQSELTRTGRKASELEKTMQSSSEEVAEAVAQQTGQDPVALKKLMQIESKLTVRDFWDANPEAKQYEQQMIELVTNKPHLAGDLDALYATAVMQSGKLNEVKSQGKQEALRSLAQKQTAAVPRGNATTQTAPKEKPFKELSIAEMEARLGTVRR